MIGIIALIGVIIAAVFAYRTARDTGRSGALWALAILGVGFGFQIFVPMIVGVVLALFFLWSGSPVEQLQEKVEAPAGIIGFIFLFLSAIGIWLVLRHLSKLPEEPPIERVPPPPTFHEHDQS
jgi:hypothetical protein